MTQPVIESIQVAGNANAGVTILTTLVLDILGVDDQLSRVYFELVDEQVAQGVGSSQGQGRVFGIVLLPILDAIGTAGDDRPRERVFAQGVGHRAELIEVRLEKFLSDTATHAQGEVFDEDLLSRGSPGQQGQTTDNRNYELSHKMLRLLLALRRARRRNYVLPMFECSLIHRHQKHNGIGESGGCFRNLVHLSLQVIAFFCASCFQDLPNKHVYQR